MNRMADESEDRQSRSRSRPDPDDGVYALVVSTHEAMMRQAAAAAEMKRDMVSMSNDLQSLTRLMRGEGDGERGFVMRMFSLEQTSKATADAIRGLQESLTGRSTADLKGRWDLTKGVIVGLIALLAAIIGAVIQGLLSGRGK